MRDNAIYKLVTAGLKKTEIRIELLSYLLEQAHAISQPELEKAFHTLSDRVTIYRALSAFEEKGIVHKIIDLQGTARYAICNEKTCNDHHHQDEHIHFQCTNCNNVICLDEISLPQLTIPSEFQVHKVNVQLEGICKNCLH
jgi:Fur family ferric uptake transcriptional regulator